VSLAAADLHWSATPSPLGNAATCGELTLCAAEPNGKCEYLELSGIIAQTDYPGKIGISSVGAVTHDDEQQQAEPLLTSSQIARRAGVSRRTVATWVQRGILVPDFITAGGQGRFRWTSVEAQLREHRRRST
jgi:hypothetical protein